METLKDILPWLQVVFSFLLMTGIIMQQSEAGIGGAFGFGGAVGNFHSKRGIERIFFIGTIVLAIVFIATALTALFVK